MPIFLDEPCRDEEEAAMAASVGSGVVRRQHLPNQAILPEGHIYYIGVRLRGLCGLPYLFTDADPQIYL